MITIFRNGYVLLLSYSPCEVFTYFNVKEMHGLSYIECDAYANTKDSAYIAGWSNFVPKASGDYLDNDDRFVFINLSRCTDPVKTFGLIMHELMHHSFWRHSYMAEAKEEEIITWAEEESYKVYDIVKPMLGKVVRQAITFKSE